MLFVFWCFIAEPNIDRNSALSRWPAWLIARKLNVPRPPSTAPSTPFYRDQSASGVTQTTTTTTGMKGEWSEIPGRQMCHVSQQRRPQTENGGVRCRQTRRRNSWACRVIMISSANKHFWRRRKHDSCDRPGISDIPEIL